MKRRNIFKADITGVGAAVDLIGDVLREYSVKGNEFVHTQLAVEEVLGSLMDHAAEGSDFQVYIKAFLGIVTIEIILEGEEYDPAGSMQMITGREDTQEAEMTGDALRAILLRAYTNDLKYRHKAGKNNVRMTVVRSRHAFLYQTIGAMILAILLGILLTQAGSDAFNNGLNDYLLVPVKTVYMNALKMIVAPVVFFSIVSCIVRFSDLSELGRIGARIITLYLSTTLIAVAVGLGSFYLFKPGNAGIMEQASDASSITSQKMEISILDTIVGIVPDNFVRPFLESNMLQLIFLAVICGIAAGKIGKYSEMLCLLFDACNELFLKVTTLIIRFMPAAVLCSVMSMMLTLGGKTMISVMSMLGTLILGLISMMVIYCLLILLIGRISPVPFMRKYSATMVQVFSMASSNAAIPLNMEACEKKLGIAKNVYSLSIPLGATINMDGTCIYLAVFSLALAKIYAVEMTGASMVSLVIAIVVLSMGAPGIPGSGLICLSVLLTQMGIPVEAVGLVMGIDSLTGMFRTMSNCMGDVAVSLIVARQEKLMDIEIYQNN